MDQIRAAEEGVREDGLHHEDGAADTPNYRQQPSAAAQADLKRKRYITIFLTIFLGIFIASGVGLFIAFLRSGYSLYAIRGNSMEPTLKNGQSVILEQSEEPQKNDIIFFRRPSGWGASPEDNEDVLVKRVVAAPGDTFSYDGENFLVNGQFLSKAPETCHAPKGYSATLNRQQLLAFGDNAQSSRDSRYYFCKGELDKIFIPNLAVRNYGVIRAQF